MEILIVGLLIVALMVYASTKIKKSAARAYEQEIVETNDYKLIKPENFIIPFEENSTLAFRARSKDVGDEETSELPQAEINLLVFPEADFETVVENAKQSATAILNEQTDENESSEKIYSFEAEEMSGKNSLLVFRKITESKRQMPNKIYELRISLLSDFREKYIGDVNLTLESFTVK